MSMSYASMSIFILMLLRWQGKTKMTAKHIFRYSNYILWNRANRLLNTVIGCNYYLKTFYSSWKQESVHWIFIFIILVKYNLSLSFSCGGFDSWTWELGYTIKLFRTYIILSGHIFLVDVVFDLLSIHHLTTMIWCQFFHMWGYIVVIHAWIL